MDEYEEEVRILRQLKAMIVVLENTLIRMSYKVKTYETEPFSIYDTDTSKMDVADCVDILD